MISFDKNSFIDQPRLSFMGIVKFSIWLNIRSKYIDYLYFIVSVTVGIFSERLTGTSCQDFSLCFLICFQLAVVKTDGKCLTEQSFFSQKWTAFFVFDLCHICLLRTSWVLFLERKLSITFCEFMLRKLHRYLLRIFSEPDMTLCYHRKQWNQSKPKAA